MQHYDSKAYKKEDTGEVKIKFKCVSFKKNLF
jgi:hypothetical protein